MCDETPGVARETPAVSALSVRGVSQPGPIDDEVPAERCESRVTIGMRECALGTHSRLGRSLCVENLHGERHLFCRLMPLLVSVVVDVVALLRPRLGVAGELAAARARAAGHRGLFVRAKLTPIAGRHAVCY